MPKVHLKAIAILEGLLIALPVAAQQPSQPETAVRAPTSTSKPVNDNAPSNVLSPNQWRRVDLAVSRALTWLANQQLADGSFPTLDSGQPGVTSLCTMAF